MFWVKNHELPSSMIPVDDRYHGLFHSAIKAPCRGLSWYHSRSYGGLQGSPSRVPLTDRVSRQATPNETLPEPQSNSIRTSSLRSCILSSLFSSISTISFHIDDTATWQRFYRQFIYNMQASAVIKYPQLFLGNGPRNRVIEKDPPCLCKRPSRKLNLKHE